MRSEKKWFFVSLVLVLMIIGYVGAGFSMRTTDTPSFCGTCHVMHPAARTHQESVHAALTCNQCHAPRGSFIEKSIFKTRSGMRDIYVNTLGHIPDVVEATTATRDIINDNCIECHFMTTLNINRQSKPRCFDCHRSVPHSGKRPIALRKVAHD